MTVASKLAGFAFALTLESVPGPIRRKLGDHVLDTLGVMCLGTGAAEHRALRRALQEQGPHGAATLIGSSGKAHPRDAAFSNAFAGRIHTFDDTLEAGPVHSGSVVTASALAASEAASASGTGFLRAVLAGYEVAARLSLGLGASHYARGFHSTGTCNALGAAAAAACARGLSEAQILSALGMAGGMAAGLRQHQIDGSMADSALNGAHAAMVGVLAADLAAEGFAGPPGIVDGALGLGALMSDGPDYDTMVHGLGGKFVFARTSPKPYPSCRFTHGPLHEAIRLVRTAGLDPGQIERIELFAFGQSIAVSDRPQFRTRTEALLSHQFTLAVALLRGRLTFADLDDAVIADPAIRALADRIRVIHDPALDSRYPASWPHRLRVTLGDGRTLEAVSDDPPGGAGQPMPRAEIVSKFERNAGPVLGNAQTAALIDAVERLETLERLDDLVRLLAHRPDGAARVAPQSLRQSTAAE